MYFLSDYEEKSVLDCCNFLELHVIVLVNCVAAVFSAEGVKKLLKVGKYRAVGNRGMKHKGRTKISLVHC